MYLYIKFQLNCFLRFHETFQWKKNFSFQKIKISFSEILFQRKLPRTPSVLLFQLRHKEELICKNEKRVL